MRPFDYSNSAELFPTRNLRARRTTVGYKRFARAADAIKFAIEELPPELLHGAHMEVNEERFDSGAIRRLYEDAGYPLPRRTPKAAGAATSNKVRAPKLAAGAAPKNGRAADGRAAEGSGAALGKGSSATTSMKSGVVKTPVKNGGAAEAKAPVAPAAKKPAPSRAAEGASAATSKTPAKKARVAVPTD
jgi:hypothetical protein